MLIINHNNISISEYKLIKSVDENKIIIEEKKRLVTINGNNLFIYFLSSDMLTIKGNIKSVVLDE